MLYVFNLYGVIVFYSINFVIFDFVYIGNFVVYYDIIIVDNGFYRVIIDGESD